MRKDKAKAKSEATFQTNIKARKAFHIEFKNMAQKIAWASFEQNDVLFLLGPAGVGKTFLAMAFAISEFLSKKKRKIILTRPIVDAGEHLGYLPGPQPLDAKILTPCGWTTMGELKIGDMVISRDGTPTKVLNIFPKGKKQVYKITTTENTSTEACEDHLWFTTSAEDRKRQRCGSVKSTKEIANSLETKKGKINHHIPRNEPVEFEKTHLPISPYILGTLIGDGHMGSSISLANIDREIIERVNMELLDLNCGLSKLGSTISHNFKNLSLTSNKPARKVKITDIETGAYEEYSSVSVAYNKKKINKGTLAHRCKNNLTINKLKYEFISLENRWSNPVKNILENLNLLGKRANNKFIPDVYKYASLQDRVNLLRGLMDTDGTVKKTGEASFTTVSKKLAEDIVELVQSLGGRAVLRTRNRLEKHAVINGRNINAKNIVYEFNVSLPQDINPFYLSRKADKFKCNWIFGVGIKSIEPVCKKEVQCILVENKEHLYITDQYIVTHNTFEDKINPYLMPLYDSMDSLVGVETQERDKVDRAVEIAPLAYLRGRTFVNSICILDEAQNCTKTQIKLFLTRLGEDSKIIVTGDPTQSDLRDEPYLKECVKLLEPVAGIGIVQFNEDSIVRHPLVGKILEKLK